MKFYTVPADIYLSGKIRGVFLTSNDQLQMTNDGVRLWRTLNNVPKAPIHLTLVIGYLTLT